MMGGHEVLLVYKYSWGRGEGRGGSKDRGCGIETTMRGDATDLDACFL